MMETVSFEQLSQTDLVVGKVYEGGVGGALAGEPISKVLPGVGNQGGIRMSGRAGARKFVVLYTTLMDRDWPDELDPETGKLVYFGDNKIPGRELHETGPGGNLLFKEVYADLHAPENRVHNIPPFFLFSRSGTAASSRSAKFHGICVPGHPGFSEMDDLVAVWKTKDRTRFQNYRAVFSVLNIDLVSRGWIADMCAGDRMSGNAPPAWRNWVESGKYDLLRRPDRASVGSSNPVQTP